MTRYADSVRTVIENPFVGAAGQWHSAAARVLRQARGRTARERSRTAEARARTLDATVASALARAMLRTEPVRAALCEQHVADRELHAYGVRREQLVSLVGAATRCQRALEMLAGDSTLLRAVKAAAWAASFGSSLPAMLRLERVVRDHDVLVSGETGSGKDAVAHAIALGTLSADERPAPFAALNIAAIPETLIESELFGHVRGAFTGAGKDRVGHVRSVACGCLFLDEVGDLPLTAQSKLLRVMETDRVTPLGSDTSYDADVRYVAATHKDLRDMVRSGTFRADLYERLAGNVIRLPSLRERPEDILPIGERFAARYLAADAPEWRRVRAFLTSQEARTHRWPGNVRELQNCLRNVLLGIAPGLLASAEPAEAAPAEGALPEAVRARSAPLAAVETWYVAQVVARCGGNHAFAARVLGVDRATVRRKLRA
ncbi:MAG: sigma-54-dependent Fis family transcriptional regulator [Polyangiaceae bacterium]|nr:sigma-54-dependent Fis family transcriptional regulator [Polyangiaceae bacterium]